MRTFAQLGDNSGAISGFGLNLVHLRDCGGDRGIAVVGQRRRAAGDCGGFLGAVDAVANTAGNGLYHAERIVGSV